MKTKEVYAVCYVLTKVGMLPEYRNATLVMTIENEKEYLTMLVDMTKAIRESEDIKSNVAITSVCKLQSKEIEDDSI